MNLAIRIERNVLGPRLFIGRFRFHHHHAGKALVLLGAWVIWIDRADLKRP